MFPIGAQDVETWTTQDEIWNETANVAGHAARSVRNMLNLQARVAGVTV